MKDISNLYRDLYGDRYDKADMDKRFEALLKRHEELFKVNFVPSEADLEKARNLGRDFAASLA